MPWRSTGCEHRSRALVYVLSRHAENGRPIVIGRHDEGPWCKALAIADALGQTQADVLVVADADCWTDGLPEAVRMAQEGIAWCVPHRSVHRLTEDATGLYLRGHDLSGLATVERPYLGVEGGGSVVIRREVIEDCPMDPRFTGWGGEDESWGLALRTLHGRPWRPRGHAPLVHCWHPEPQRATRSFGSLAGRELRKRYARAVSYPQTMRELVDEGRAHGASRFAESPRNDCSALGIG